ncbi:MAG TPA: HPF/RaiA family ribosome-associated protein [Tepidisphaeraceae bacterium]|nr:HPF/RaiA family ribosome-associated protein [Tepidisphaeraceae bacterium]
MNDTQILTITGIRSAALDEHIRERLHHALNQHEGQVRSLRVSVRDINGPRGGEDMQVRIIVGLRGSADVVIEETGADSYAAISLAAERVKQTVGRRLGRRK